MEESRKIEPKFFLVRTSVGQEMTSALLIKNRCETERLPVHSVIVLPDLRGYIYIEADSPFPVEEAIRDIKYVKRRVQGSLSVNEFKKYFEEKPVSAEIRVGDTVEIVSGLLKKNRAKVIEINPERNEVTVELDGAIAPFPITLKMDSVRVVEKSSGKL
ncbi:MAG: transcription elongation factor Spt5 [Candidatus Brockarchaeota archaeon]|nr:transcription elongation factor Spt5 [Candidatus Brockarchaeota archaeon]